MTEVVQAREAKGIRLVAEFFFFSTLPPHAGSVHVG